MVSTAVLNGGNSMLLEDRGHRRSILPDLSSIGMTAQAWWLTGYEIGENPVSG